MFAGNKEVLMRVIGYVSGYYTPVIDHVSRMNKLKIYGGRFLENGDLALLCHNGSKFFVLMVYPKPFPSSLDEAMEQRKAEIDRNVPLFEFFSDNIRNLYEEAILHQEKSVLWAMELDPEE